MRECFVKVIIPENCFNECEKLPGRIGYDLGIFTSTALVTVNK
jgi:hypothetical protein